MAQAPRHKDLAVGTVLRSTSPDTAAGAPITVTEITKTGFRYATSTPVDQGFGCIVNGGEKYLHDGRAHGFALEA